MDCERYQIEIEDLLYGELGERRAAELRAHLADCPACAALREQVECENALYAEFYEQTEIEPAGEMWEAIRERIQAEPRTAKQEPKGFGVSMNWLWRPAVLRQLAFAIGLIVLSAGATLFILKRNEKGNRNLAGEPAPATSPTRQPAIETAQQRADLALTPATVARTPTRARPPARKLASTDEPELLRQQLARAEREYQNAVRLLDRAIARRRDSFDPALIRQYESSLALIDQSIAQSRQALRQRPNDLNAGQFLLSAYAKKVELMQDIAMQ